MYQQNKLYTEALNTYSSVVKNKQFPQAGRLRVNMGNLYFEQRKYPNAIKMYRMALDQIPNTARELRFKVCAPRALAVDRPKHRTAPPDGARTLGTLRR